jgi:hypothetical protein
MDLLPADLHGWYAGDLQAPSGWEPAARVEMFDPDTDTDDDGGPS